MPEAGESIGDSETVSFLEELKASWGHRPGSKQVLSRGVPLHVSHKRTEDPAEAVLTQLKRH